MIIYLAAPYSDKDPAITEARMAAFCRVDAILMARGLITVSPLSKHFILRYGDLPGSWEYWKNYSLTLMKLCDTFAIIHLDGWEVSEGVQEELAEVIRLGLIILHLDRSGNEIKGF